MSEGYLQHYGVVGMKWGVRGMRRDGHNKNLRKNLSNNLITRHAQKKTLKKITKMQGSGDQLTAIGENSKKALSKLNRSAKATAKNARKYHHVYEKAYHKYTYGNDPNDWGVENRNKMRALGSEYLRQVEKGLNKTNSALRTYGQSLVKDVYQSRSSKRQQAVENYVAGIVEEVSEISVNVDGKNDMSVTYRSRTTTSNAVNNNYDPLKTIRSTRRS